MAYQSITDVINKLNLATSGDHESFVKIDSNVLVWAEYWLRYAKKHLHLKDTLDDYKKETPKHWNTDIPEHWKKKEPEKTEARKLDPKEISRILRYVAGCVDYTERITKLPDCNTCGDKKNCPYVPACGDNARINCPFWEEEKRGDFRDDPDV
jgi:hypothetical protein